jgi:multidrug transporter EmrE-like cation transporter
MGVFQKFNYIYIFGTIFFTVYGQLVLKWRVGLYGGFPDGYKGKIGFFFEVLLDPWIISGLLSAIVASLFWIAAMTKFDLSYAYPFMSLSFVLVFFLSIWFFQEPITVSKLAGLGLIVCGILVSSRSL